MALHAQDLSVRAGERILFRGLSFSLGPGESVAVRGPSGAGKTLLLRQLARLDPLVSGNLQLNTESPESMGIPRWRKRVTYVAQETPGFDGCAHDIFALFSRFATWRQTDDPVPLAESWGIPAAAWKQRFASLSGGERQRIYLAIVLASKPDVLLLDEPTSHLDEDAVQAVERSLRAWPSVWVTHEEAQARRVGSQTLDLRDFGAGR